MPMYDKTLPLDTGTMTFPMPRLSWKLELAKFKADPDAFAERVRATGYMLAMNRHNPEEA